LLACLGFPEALPAESLPAQSLDAREVFARYSDRVVMIRVVERDSGAKAVFGTGFAISPSGHVVTNYHVVSNLVHEPEHYRAELVRESGDAEEATLLAIDVVHDLALVRAESGSPTWFELGSGRVPAGARMYSLGHPLDLGLSIVEGTYNGLVRHALYDKIHLTGSLNPGMSGGPTILGDGQVVGVNVASAGNQVGFLVPVARVKRLSERALAPGFRVPDDFLADATRQLDAHQARYLGELLERPFETVELAGYRVPGQLAPFFKCWGDAERAQHQPYETFAHQCSTEDYLFVSHSHFSGVVSFRHRVIETHELDRFRFFALYSSLFAETGYLTGARDEVTNFRCRSDLVSNASGVLKAVLCLRRYRKLPGLYDAVLKAATLGKSRSGFETQLILSGVSIESVERFGRRYLEAVEWDE
jgi:serine protease Do